MQKTTTKNIQNYRKNVVGEESYILAMTFAVKKTTAPAIPSGNCKTN